MASRLNFAILSLPAFRMFVVQRRIAGPAIEMATRAIIAAFTETHRQTE